MLTRFPGRVALCGVLAAACGTDPVALTQPEFASSPVEGASVSPFLVGLNSRIGAAGAAYRVDRAEYLVALEPGAAAGQIVFASDRTKRLASRWVPGDPRRATLGTDIRYAHFEPLMSANAGPGHVRSDATDGIERAFRTWDALRCSALDLEPVALPADVIPSAVLALAGFANDPFLADINTVGFVPGSIFDQVLGPGAARNVLGVTFTFIWGANTAEGFVPSDVDADGRNDTAFKEIWYNDAFAWSLIGGGWPAVDIETVALHESGHALELGHFGSIFLTSATRELHAAPRAVMNAAILGDLRTPLGSDNAAFCGNFADWSG